MNLTIKTAIALAMTFVTTTTAGATSPAVISQTTADGHTIYVTAVTDHILKVDNFAPGEKLHTSRAAVLDISGAVIPEGVVIDASSSTKTIKTDAGIVATLTTDGSLTINAGKGRQLTDDGKRTAINGKRIIDLTVTGKGSFYGAGERGHRLNLRGDTLIMYNRQNYGYTGSDPRISQMNITMPLALSSDGYAVLFDDYTAADMILNDHIVYRSESQEPVSYYYITSDGSLADLTTQVTALTGRQELPPLWSLGYITSKYGYHDETEALDAVDSLKTLGYPLDGIVLDLYWYGKEQDMGRLEWDKKQWPDPKYVTDYLKAKGVKLVTITQPYLLRNGRGVDNYNTLAENGMLVKDATTGKPLDVKIWVGEGGMFDVSNPDTQLWLTNRLDSLMKTGITGWWGDLGEPEVHPENGLHANGLTTRQYHNQYGNDWSEIVYNLFKTRHPDQRLLSMMRGGTTGLQRYDVFPWSTDVSRSWGGLEPQVRIMLNSGLSGLGYMSHDVGGFAIDEKHPYDPDLYLRWMQLGLFSPMLRTHAQATAEPYNYPSIQYSLKKIVTDRYRWLPYNYTLAWENATKGWPLVRTLDFHDAEPCGKYDNISDQYLWGRDVMVVPILRDGPAQDERKIIFPEGSDWIDILYPRMQFRGGTKVTYLFSNEMPVFVRAGAFITTAEYPMRSTDNYRVNNYCVNYYPKKGLASTGYLFEDDTKTPSTLSENKGRIITFTATPTDGDKFIDVSFAAEGTYKGASEVKTMTFTINGLDKEPAWIEIDGKNARILWNKEKGIASVSFVWNVTRTASIRIKR